jgi:hypothetical protein
VALVAPQPEGIPLPLVGSDIINQPAGGRALKTLIAAYSITMGVAMLAVWSAFWALGAIPEMMSRPWEIAMHLTAEFTTAGLLITSGIALLVGARWAVRVNVFASGMLVYSLIQSPGYYLQNNAMLFVLLLAVAFLVTVMISPAFKPQPPTSFEHPE